MLDTKRIVVSWSLYNPVIFRFAAFVALLSLIFYAGISLISFLVIREKKPLCKNALQLSLCNRQISPLVSAQNSLSSLLSDRSLAPTLCLSLSLLTLLKPRNSATPPLERSDSALFDHRAFYQTLNNSSHYLRRDSFAV